MNNDKKQELLNIRTDLGTFHTCAIYESPKIVFGRGFVDAEIMFIGEAPGKDEERLGLPFVGRSGGLLARMLKEAGISPVTVYIANVLKCRPPDNRDPKPQEVKICVPYLLRQIETIDPKVICTLGNFAWRAIGPFPEAGVTSVRDRVFDITVGEGEYKLAPTVHPAAALRNPKMKDMFREDIHKLKELL